MTVATNLGTGGAVLDAQYGSAPTPNTNEPLLLGHTGENHLYLPGVAGNYASTPDAAALDITGDIDIRVRVAMDDWTPSAEVYLLSKYTTTGDQRSYALSVASSGRIALRNAADGVTAVYRETSVVPSFVDGTSYWLKATLAVSSGGNNIGAFYFAADQATEPTAWTQIGSNVSTVGATSIFSGTAPLNVGSINSGASGPAAAKFFRAIVRSDPFGTPTTVFDADFTSGITSGAQTTFTESSSNAATVTINRSTAGRKACAVVRPVWLLGSDDFFEVADNALLDFGAGDDFTVVVVGRKWGSTLSMVLLAKSAAQNSTMTGWAVAVDGAAASTFRVPMIGDGTTRRLSTVTGYTEGSLFAVAGVRDITADNLTGYLNGTAGTPVTDTTTGTLANNEVMRIGRLSGGGTDYADAELLAVAVFRRALTAAELSTIATYYGAV